MTTNTDLYACDTLEEALFVFNEGLGLLSGPPDMIDALTTCMHQMLGWHYPRLRAPTHDELMKAFSPEYRLMYSAGGVALDREGYAAAVAKMAANGIDCDVRLTPLAIGPDIALVDDIHRWTLPSGETFTSQRWGITRFRNGQRVSTDVIVRNAEAFAQWHSENAAAFGHG